jgi:hypothetical protein
MDRPGAVERLLKMVYQSPSNLADTSHSAMIADGAAPYYRHGCRQPEQRAVDESTTALSDLNGCHDAATRNTGF